MYRTVLYGHGTRALYKHIKEHHTAGKVPPDTQALILAVDVERSGPDAMVHSTIAVGAALVAWGVLPGTRTAFHKLVHRACWGSLASGTRFDDDTWKTFWSKQDSNVLHSFVCTDPNQDAHNRNDALMFIMAQSHAAAQAHDVPLHVVSDNPGYDVPHIDAWLRSASLAQDVARACSATPLKTIDAGGLPCVAQQFNMAHGLHYDSNGRWRRVKCLRSMQEGVIAAADKTRGLHITQHSATVHQLYTLPMDARVVSRNSHTPDEDAHVCAIDYAHILSIRTGHALRRKTHGSAQ